MVKLRLDYFLMRGGLFVTDDVYRNKIGSVTVIYTAVQRLNSGKKRQDIEFIESFTPRENNGSQPVPDDFPVRASVCGSDIDNGVVREASSWSWALSGEITLWKPDIEKLIEQQIEYDKQQEQSIEELMISKKGNNMPIYTQEMKEAGKYAPVGSKVQIINNSKYDLEYGEDILGLEVTVRSEPIPTSGGYFIQVVEYEGIAYCFVPDMIFPFKSQEEIEREDAAEKRVGELANRYSHWFSGIKAAIAFFESLQENGELAEIILPLESN